jgi:hypothetical protein
MHCCRGEIDLSGQNQPDSVTWVTSLARRRSWEPQDLLDKMEEKQAGPALYSRKPRLWNGVSEITGDCVIRVHE